MFHSNQHLDITAELSELPFLLETAAHLSGDLNCMTRDKNYVLPAWRITNNDMYFCVGTGNLIDEPDGDMLDEGWTQFDFKYDPEKIAIEIKKWLKTRTYPRSDCDGMVEPGVRMQVFHATLTRMPDGGIETEEEWDDYMSCIACFSPWNCEFEK